MKFLILDHIPPAIFETLHQQNPGLGQQPYQVQYAHLCRYLFDGEHLYVENLTQLGHEARFIPINGQAMQQAWAREHSLPIPPARHWKFEWRKGVVPWLRQAPNLHWKYEILAAQIEQYRPDVLLNLSMFLDTHFLREIKPAVRLLVGQHAATPLPEREDWGCYDLVLSSFPPTLEWFEQKGVAAQLLRLGFNARVLPKLAGLEQTIPVGFIGSFHSEVHHSRITFLEGLCAQFEVKVWAPTVEHLAPTSPIRRSYMGQARGLEMFQRLAQCQITLNHHGDILPYANNYRLFEATGVGTLLLTDWKENLAEMFEVGREVVAYRTPEECAELIAYYLAHDTEREAIAQAGQARTLNEHTFYHRMRELVGIVSHYL